jgi:hypothetical protein
MWGKGLTKKKKTKNNGKIDQNSIIDSSGRIWGK